MGVEPSICNFEVDWSDCDPAGIVFYPQFFRMMNTGTHKLFEHAGIPYPEIVARYGGFGTPLLDVQSTFRSAAKFGAPLRLESRIAEWRRSTFVVEHVMKSRDAVVFEAKEIRAWVTPDETRAAGMRSAPVPPEIKALFKDVPEAPPK